MPDPIVNDAIVTAISQQLPNLTDEQVGQVLQTWNSVLDGDPIGTIRRNTNGDVAHRVTADNVPVWRVSAADGGQWNDLSPHLDWPVVFTPETGGANK